MTRAARPFAVAAVVAVLALGGAVAIVVWRAGRGGEESPTGRSFVEPAPPRASAVLRGSVKALDGGKPLLDARIRAVPSRAGASPSECLVATDGSFEIAIPQDFEGELMAIAPGFAVKSVHVPREFVAQGLRYDFALVPEE